MLVKVILCLKYFTIKKKNSNIVGKYIFVLTLKMPQILRYYDMNSNFDFLNKNVFTY